MGFSGSIWILANVFTALTVHALSRLPTDGRLPWSLLCLGLLGALSYSTSLSLWPGLLLAAVLHGVRRRQLAAIAAGAGAIYLWQALVRTRPANHPKPNLTSPGTQFEYVGRYLGWPFVDDLGVATALGLGGVALAATATVLAWRWKERAAAPFVALAAFGLTCAIGTAVGRSGMGIEQAASSRYVSLAVLFWLGTLGAVALVLRRTPWLSPVAGARAAVAVVAVVLPLLAAGTWTRGQAVLTKYLEHARWHDLADLALRQGFPDDRDILQYVNNAPEQFADCTRWLRRMQHVPFGSPRRSDIGTVIANAAIEAEPRPDLTGNFDGLLQLPGGGMRAGGWVVSTGPAIERLHLVDAEGTVCGDLVTGMPRRDIAALRGAEHSHSGFFGYLVRQPVGDLRVVVRLDDETVFRQISGTYAKPN
jgi:hypothetical protein